MPDDRPIFVISDMHIGDGGPRDSFPQGDREKQLTLFLDHVDDQHGELVILGDLFEFWQMNLSKIIVNHIPLLDRLAAMAATYVVGNHDADLAHFIDTDFLSHPLFQRMCGPFERRLGDKRFKFMHGHEADSINKGDDPGKGRIFCITAGLFEDRNNSPVNPDGDYVEDDLEKIGEALLGPWTAMASRIGRLLRLGGLGMADDHLTPAQSPNQAKQMLAFFRDDMDDSGYDVLVTGHTHQPGHIGDWYFNSGTWARKTNSFVRIDVSGDVAVCDWVNGRPVANDTVLEL